MISILEAAPWLKSDAYRLILQCQSKTPVLRKYLSDNGWQVTKESVIRDGRFLYTVMAVDFTPESPRLTAAQCYIPPALLENPSDTVADYYKWVVGGLEIAAQHQKDGDKQKVLSELRALAGQEAFQWLEMANGNGGEVAQ